MSVFSCTAPGRLQKLPAVSHGPGSLPELRQAIDAVLQDSILVQTRTGIKIVSLRSGEVLYARDSQLLFHPASNMKLLTTAAALKYLGPGFQFKTLMLADSAAVGDSTLRGDLFLKGHAAPDLSSEDFRSMVQQLQHRGIREISGDIVCDESYLDDYYLGSGWMWDDVSSLDYAPISALAVNHNCVVVEVQPGGNIGDPLIVHMAPQTAYMRVINVGTTVDSTDTLAIDHFDVERRWRPLPANIIEVRGGMPVGSKPRRFDIDVVDAARYAGTLLQERLHEAGIAFKGTVRKDTLPEGPLQVLMEHRSEPLAKLVADTNKPSDNLFAELMLKTVGAEVRGTPGTAKKGLSVIKEMFWGFGVDTTAFQLADGSGVSRYNIVTPDQIVELLKYMHGDFRIQAEFKASLPIAGVDGSLSGRMKGTAAEGLLRAKTGTLNGVSALSGYTMTADGEPLAFSIMMEHYVVRSARIRDVQDKIGALMSSFSRGTPSNATTRLR